MNHLPSDGSDSFQVPCSIFGLGLSASELIFLVLLHRLRQASDSMVFRATNARILADIRLSSSTLKNVRKKLLVREIIRYWRDGRSLIYELLPRDGKGQNVPS